MPEKKRTYTLDADLCDEWLRSRSGDGAHKVLPRPADRFLGEAIKAQQQPADPDYAYRVLSLKIDALTALLGSEWVAKRQGNAMRFRLQAVSTPSRSEVWFDA